MKFLIPLSLTIFFLIPKTHGQELIFFLVDSTGTKQLIHEQEGTRVPLKGERIIVQFRDESKAHNQPFEIIHGRGPHSIRRIIARADPDIFSLLLPYIKSKDRVIFSRDGQKPSVLNFR